MCAVLLAAATVSGQILGTNMQAEGNLFTTTLFSKFKVRLDVTKDAKGLPMLRYNVEMPSNTYIGFCYGTDMRNTDMVAFLANTQTVQVQDLFAYGNSRPPKDS